MSQLRFYAHPFSNNALRAQLALDEKGLDYEYVKVELFTGEHKKSDYLAINPRGQVPCLVDGKAVVFESVAIVEYLDRRYPTPSLVPSDPVAMAKCLRRVAEFHQKLDPKNVYGSVKFRKQRRAELGDRVDALLKECAVWEGYAGESDYFAGDAYSMADIVVLPFFAVTIDGLGLPAAQFPKLHAWYQRCLARPVVAKQPWFAAFAPEKANTEQHVLAGG
jgi:glutathione S-transferase